jgi:quinoprotein glucose dehydrogenase
MFGALLRARWRGIAFVAFLMTGWKGQLAAEPADSAPRYSPRVLEASGEADRALSGIRVPKGFRVELFAAEPMLANPVAFCVDEHGRFYVAETFRHHAGVTDNRYHMNWLDDDLASRTVADRVAMYRKYLGDGFASYQVEHERVRRIEDRDGDGRADSATVFADGFNDAADGIAAGLLARRGQVWFTCLPTLWKLADQDGDGRADVRTPLHTGFGVHVAFLGHDLHGLKLGPDGRLYFSIGDRGFHVETEGKTLDYPDTGAVLRCQPDGSELEVFATGLRNPQELAFDEWGNLFTGDNNSDGGDKARWVHIVEGGDSGWRIGYQYITRPTSRGPWNAEKLWTPEGARAAPYLVPPIANLGDGPSGLTYYPGTGLSAEYAGHFFLADFRGTPSFSGVRSFRLAPKGATFEVVDAQQFAWSVLATDVDFGVDSALYVSDWVEGWEKTGKGRIFRIVSESQQADSQAAEVRRLLDEGMTDRGMESLVKLLGHPDMRIRQEAQFALVERGIEIADRLVDVATNDKNRLARVHAIWGLGQLLSRADAPKVDLTPLLADADAEIRAQAAKVTGEAGLQGAYEPLVALLKDDQSRVRFFAALSLGKLARAAAIPHLIELLRENNNEDPLLRHAAVMALAWTHDAPATLAWADDASAAVRMGVLLALRRWESPDVARFLDDADATLVLEAARAINDVPIEAARPSLAKLALRDELPEHVPLRVLNALYRGGGAEDARQLARWAASANRSEATRVEALSMLRDWERPNGKDRVMGLWRPLPNRPAEDARVALGSQLEALTDGLPDNLAAALAQAAGALRLKEAAGPLSAIATDGKRSTTARIAAFEALGQIGESNFEATIRLALEDREGAIRTIAQRWLARLKPADAIPWIEKALASESLEEQQGAYVALGEIEAQQANDVLVESLDRLLAGSLPPPVRLDLCMAAERKQGDERIRDRLVRLRGGHAADDPIAQFRNCLEGGNRERGRDVFFEKAAAACVRCHKIGTRGGEVGPALAKIAKDQTREYLLESIVAPNQKIAKGFETVVLALDDGQVVTGVLKSEDDAQVNIVTADGQPLAIAKQSIEERGRGASAMPEHAAKLLTPSEIRDLVEYLSSLR